MKSKFFPILLIIGAIYLYSNLCILYGVAKERENSICISPEAQSFAEDNLRVAQEICVSHYNAWRAEQDGKLSSCQADLKKWQNSFYKLKSAATSTASSTLQ